MLLSSKFIPNRKKPGKRSMEEFTYQKRPLLVCTLNSSMRSLRPFGFEEFRISCSLCHNETNYQIKLIYDLQQTHNLLSGGYTTLELRMKKSWLNSINS